MPENLPRTTSFVGGSLAWTLNQVQGKGGAKRQKPTFQHHYESAKRTKQPTNLADVGQ